MRLAKGLKNYICRWRRVAYSSWAAIPPIWVGFFSGVGVDDEGGGSAPLAARVVGFGWPISACGGEYRHAAYGTRGVTDLALTTPEVWAPRDLPTIRSPRGWLRQTAFFFTTFSILRIYVLRRSWRRGAGVRG